MYKHIEVISANNGFEALKQFQTMDFDALFLDYDMPILNGLETAN